MTVARRGLVDREAQAYSDDLAKELEQVKSSWSGKQPTNPIKGQLWYDESTETLKVYNDDPISQGAIFMPLRRGVDQNLVAILDGAANSFQFVALILTAAGGSTSFSLDITTPTNSGEIFGKTYHCSVKDTGGPYDGTEGYKILPIDDRGGDGSNDFEVGVLWTDTESPSVVGAVLFVQRVSGSDDLSFNCRLATHGPYDEIADLTDPIFSGVDSSPFTGTINQYLLREPDSEGSNGQFLATDGSGGRSWVSQSASGATDFLGLTDTPSSYSGQGLKIVRVNSGASALEFADLGGTWSSFTPTISGSGSALGNGTLSGRYTQVGKTVHYKILFNLGSTSTVGTGLAFNLPVNGHSSYSAVPPAGSLNSHWPSMGQTIMSDSSTALSYYGSVRADGGGGTVSKVYPMHNAASLVTGEVGSYTFVGPNDPFTWATGDTIAITGTYEAA